MGDAPELEVGNGPLKKRLEEVGTSLVSFKERVDDYNASGGREDVGAYAIVKGNAEGVGVPSDSGRRWSRACGLSAHWCRGWGLSNRDFIRRVRDSSIRQTLCKKQIHSTRDICKISVDPSHPVNGP